MVENVKKTYTDFHNKKVSAHLYPTEWVIRTLLGNYPELKLDRSGYEGGKVLDLGFGDGRNIPLLLNCGLSVYGVETTKEICELAKERINSLTGNSSIDLRVGSNAGIPFEEGYFDYLLASSSCYYIDGGSTFDDNLREMSRVLKKGGWLIANFPLLNKQIKGIEESFILQNCEYTEDGHIIVQNDIYGIRNGYKFKAFTGKEELEKCIAPYFNNSGFGFTYDHYFGVQINTLFVACQKK